MNILKLHVVIALVAAAVLTPSDCQPNGIFSFDAQIVDPRTGVAAPGEIVYQVCDGIVNPKLQIQCLHNCICGGFAGCGPCQCGFPSSNIIVYKANYVDPFTDAEIPVTIAFELSATGILNPEAKITFDGCAGYCGCPISGTFTSDAYRIDPISGAKKPIIVTLEFDHGVFTNKILNVSARNCCPSHLGFPTFLPPPIPFFE